MGEYKKNKEYQRGIVCRHLLDFLHRCYIMNSGKLDSTDIASDFRIKEATLFGSFVNSDKERVHDLDIHIDLDVKYYEGEENYILKKWLYLAPKSYSYLTQITWVYEGGVRYLKNKSPILSLDSYDEIDKLTGRKVKIIENYKFIPKNIEMVFNENNVKLSDNLKSFLYDI